MEEVCNLRKEISELKSTVNTIEHYTGNFHKLLEITGDVKPVEQKPKKILTPDEMVQQELDRLKAIENLELIGLSKSKFG